MQELRGAKRRRSQPEEMSGREILKSQCAERLPVRASPQVDLELFTCLRALGASGRSVGTRRVDPRLRCVAVDEVPENFLGCLPREIFLQPRESLTNNQRTIGLRPPTRPQNVSQPISQRRFVFVEARRHDAIKSWFGGRHATRQRSSAVLCTCTLRQDCLVSRAAQEIPSLRRASSKRSASNH